MNGPEHYAEAERLLTEGEGIVTRIAEFRDNPLKRDDLGKKVMGIWAQADVHATLAVAAATIEAARARPDVWSWDKVTGAGS